MRIFADDFVQVRYVKMYNPKVKGDMKLLVIGDVHISDVVSFKKIDLLKKQIEKENPDYILFTGDLIDRIENLSSAFSLSKLKDLLSYASMIGKVFVVFGNHDFIYRGTDRINKKALGDVVKSIKNVRLLDNEVYCDDFIWIMGYTENVHYYNKKCYNFEAFYDDLKKRDKLYKNVNQEVPSIALVHSPEFSDDDKCLSLFKEYDLILSGHTHDGCVPFGIGNFKWGIISPKKTFFPRNVRGLRKVLNGYILITGGAVKIQECAPKLLHPFNHLCPVQMDVVILSNDKNEKIWKKWY